MHEIYQKNFSLDGLRLFSGYIQLYSGYVQLYICTAKNV